MRAFRPMLRWLSPGIFALVLLIAAVVPARAAGDTGTYRILDYSATLQPQSSGAVKIIYRQQWHVLSGNIPWLQVGMADSSFTVTDWGDAAARVSPDNSNGFVGVRVDLDKTYLTGDTFWVSFTVIQNNLLERLTSEKKWRIVFVPGWYDRGAVDRLSVVLNSPVSLDSYSLIDPLPASSTSNTITWEKTGLAPGVRFQVKVECLNGSFLAATTPGAKKGASPWPTILVILFIIIFIGLVVFAVRKAKQARDAALKERIAATELELASDKSKQEAAEKGFREYIIKEDIKPDEQGRYYDRNYGDYITPAIWTAVILNQQYSNQTGSSGVHTCACACVSCACACACACAGGGAAGCSRKSMHECRDCGEYIRSTITK
jgi:hypothetical protein